jgi:hypothetical protein
MDSIAYVSHDVEATQKLWILTEACCAEKNGTEVDFIASDPKHIKQFNKKFGVMIDEPTLTKLLIEDHMEAIKYIHVELDKVGKKASNVVSCLGKILNSDENGVKIYSYIRIGILPVHPKHISLAIVSDEHKEYVKNLNNVETKIRRGKV